MKPVKTFQKHIYFQYESNTHISKYVKEKQRQKWSILTEVGILQTDKYLYLWTLALQFLEFMIHLEFVFRL